VIGISQVIGSAIAGCAASCGAVLIVAGASKLYRGIRGFDDVTAIRRALRLPQRQWRLFGLVAGGTECLVGALVCSGAYPVLGGASLKGGEGTIVGTGQKGATDLKLASLRRDKDLVRHARDAAFAVVDADPTLAGHPALADEIKALVDDDDREFLFKS
jgi:hypothetical protein